MERIDIKEKVYRDYEYKQSQRSMKANIYVYLITLWILAVKAPTIIKREMGYTGALAYLVSSSIVVAILTIKIRKTYLYEQKKVLKKYNSELEKVEGYYKERLLSVEKSIEEILDKKGISDQYKMIRNYRDLIQEGRDFQIIIGDKIHYVVCDREGNPYDIMTVNNYAQHKEYLSRKKKMAQPKVLNFKKEASSEHAKESYYESLRMAKDGSVLVEGEKSQTAESFIKTDSFVNKLEKAINKALDEAESSSEDKDTIHYKINKRDLPSGSWEEVAQLLVDSGDAVAYELEKDGILFTL